MFNWTVKWWKYILGHTLLGFAFTEAVTGFNPAVWQILLIPQVLLLYGEVKENYSKRKPQGLSQGGFKVFWSILKFESSSKKQLSEWFLAGLFASTLMFAIKLLV